MTTIYNKTSDADKDFQNAIDERFKYISEQIRSLQKALANHRHDFNYRLSHLEDLLSLRYAIVALSAQYNNRYASLDLESMKAQGINCCCFHDKELCDTRYSTLHIHWGVNVH